MSALWSVYCGDKLLYDARLPEYKLPSLKLSQELNKADTLQFSIYPQHPNFSEIAKLKPTITVQRGSTIVSKSRVLDDTVGWENGKDVITEGPLAWLNDSIQRPFSFPVDDSHTTPADYFEFLLTRHNAQVDASRQLALGNVTVTDPNGYISRSDSEYSTTWTLMKQGLLDTLGGYIVPRYSGTTIYLDYLADFSVLANQPVKFGLNLLTLKTERKGADIATAVLPLGKKDETTGARLTISDLSDSETSDICKEGDIVYSKQAETLYGSRIVVREVWDDVTVASNLLTKATARLAEVRQMPSTVTLTAADLAAAGYNYNSFSLGTYVSVEDDWHASAHGLSATYLVKKLTIDLLNPAQNTITLGATSYSMTETTQREIATAMQTVEANVTRETASAIAELEESTQSAIRQSEEEIQLSVEQNYFTRGEANALVESTSTSLNITKDEILAVFGQYKQDAAAVQNGNDAQFNALYRYIQMSGGSITLGEVGSNKAFLKIDNNRIGLYVDSVEVTYWTASDFVAPKTLRVPAGGRLLLGDFAFIPRSNGSLDFTWVGG